MKRLFARWFSSREKAAAIFPQQSAVQLPALVFRTDKTYPIVDWDAMHALSPATDEPEVLDAYRTAAARAWLESLRLKCGDAFVVRESPRFLLLSPLAERAAQDALAFLERSRKRVRRVLDGIAIPMEIGKAVVLVFQDIDQYYDYISNYFPAEGEFAQSSGVFLHDGYGHFAFREGDMTSVEPIIVHELTHCLLQHLPIPAWLNEGIAVSTEHHLAPLSGRALYTPKEMQQKHLDYWNEDTIQEFWSGKSWDRPDDGNLLSYDLAVHFVAMCSTDFSAFRRFANAATGADSGDAAAREHLGFPTAHLAEAVLGGGHWEPDPEKWLDGVERGQF